MTDSTGTDAWVDRRRQLNSASIGELKTLFEQEIPLCTRPDSYIRSLDYGSRAQALRFCLGAWFATNKKQCPRQIQLETALALYQRRDVFLCSGTGSGKTLASVLVQLMTENERITVILCPLKRLQQSQVRVMNTFTVICTN
jgi:hypothetical protein